MDALLTTIQSITPLPSEGAAEVMVTPACVLPARSAVPEWLKEQTLTLVRAVADLRELGQPGDSLVLAAAESARWLQPLRLEPAVAYGALPETLRLSLAWWKDDNPPEATVQANGRTVKVKFAKDGEGFVASLATADFFPAPPYLPVAWTVTWQKLTLTCTVLPAHEPCGVKLATPRGEVFHLENTWYALDVTPRGGGMLTGWHEQGRVLDHLATPRQRIAVETDIASHFDRFTTGWGMGDRLKDVTLPTGRTWPEGDGWRLALAGVADEGMGLHTEVACHLYDAFPLLAWERSFQFRAGKKEESKDEKPSLASDHLRGFGMGFRASWVAERGAMDGSRLFCAAEGELVTVRHPQVNDFARGANWRMTGGWALVEHPGRQSCILYLFDPSSSPHLGSWSGPACITLEPYWPMLPAQTGDIFRLPLAMSVGETCGAAADGAWVACRTRTVDGVRCAVIACLPEPRLAVITHGAETRLVALQVLILPGIGAIAAATTEFAGSTPDAPFTVTVDGIPSRRTA